MTCWMWAACPAPARLQPPTTELRAERLNVPLAVARPLAARARTATTPSATAAHRIRLPISDSSRRDDRATLRRLLLAQWPSCDARVDGWILPGCPRPSVADL